MCLDPIPFGEWIPDRRDIPSAALATASLRLDHFGIPRDNERSGIRPLSQMRSLQKDSIACDSVDLSNERNWKKGYKKYNLYAYIEGGLAMTGGFPVLIRIPMNGYCISGELEFSFYKPVIDTTDCSISWKKVTYCIHNEPENYEETLPTIRDVSKAEIDSISKSSYRDLLYSPKSGLKELIDCFSEQDERNNVIR